MHYIEFFLFICVVGLFTLIALTRYLITEFKKKQLEDALYISSDKLLDEYERIYREKAEDQMQQLVNWKDSVAYNCEFRRSKKALKAVEGNVTDMQRFRANVN